MNVLQKAQKQYLIDEYAKVPFFVGKFPVSGFLCR